MEKEEFDSFLGLFEWVTRFLLRGADLCREGYQCRRANKSKYRRGMTAGVKPSAGLAAAINDTLLAVDARAFKPLVSDPCFWHGGVAVSADASTNDGWACMWAECARLGGGNQRRSSPSSTAERSCLV